MSKNSKAKVIKNKKKLNWGKVWYYVKSLFSNQIVFDCGSSKKWYVAVIMALLSLIVTVIPISVSVSQSSGASFVNGTSADPYTYGLNYYVENKTQVGDIKFSEGVATYEKESAIEYNVIGETKVVKPIMTYERSAASGQNYTNEFCIYFIPTTAGDFATQVNYILSPGKYGLSTDTSKVNTSSLAIFGVNNFYGVLYNYTKATSVGTVNGDYKSLREGLEGKTFYQILTNDATTPTGYLDNFKTFAYDSYINNRTTLMWVQTGMVAGINAGILILMGLVMFLMTRGKNNPNRVIKWYQCYGMAAWAAPSPALLTLIMGFILPSYAVMYFVLFYGFRIMWMSMKQLRPAV
jgi:hypothetical protein